jgi:hypothetical protein
MKVNTITLFSAALFATCFATPVPIKKAANTMVAAKATAKVNDSDDHDSNSDVAAADEDLEAAKVYNKRRESFCSTNPSILRLPKPCPCESYRLIKQHLGIEKGSSRNG